MTLEEALELLFNYMEIMSLKQGDKETFKDFIRRYCRIILELGVLIILKLQEG